MTGFWLLVAFVAGMAGGAYCLLPPLVDAIDARDTAEAVADSLADELALTQQERDSLAADVVSLREGARHNVIPMLRKVR